MIATAIKATGVLIALVLLLRAALLFRGLKKGYRWDDMRRVEREFHDVAYRKRMNTFLRTVLSAAGVILVVVVLAMLFPPH